MNSIENIINTVDQLYSYYPTPKKEKLEKKHSDKKNKKKKLKNS